MCDWFSGHEFTLIWQYIIGGRATCMGMIRGAARVNGWMISVLNRP
jgi:hypothetical protein